MVLLSSAYLQIPDTEVNSHPFSFAGPRCRHGGRHRRSGLGSHGPHWSHVLKKQETKAISRKDCAVRSDYTFRGGLVLLEFGVWFMDFILFYNKVYFHGIK